MRPLRSGVFPRQPLGPFLRRGNFTLGKRQFPFISWVTATRQRTARQPSSALSRWSVDRRRSYAGPSLEEAIEITGVAKTEAIGDLLDWKFGILEPEPASSGRRARKNLNGRTG